LWRKKITVLLSSHEVEIRRNDRQRASAVKLPVRQAWNEEERTWQPALAALSAWFKEQGGLRIQANLVLSDRFARYAVLPWSPAVRTDLELAMVSRLHMESVYGLPFNDQTIATDFASYGKPGVMCALPKDLIDEAENLFKQHRTTVSSIQTLFIASHNRSCKHLPANVLHVSIEDTHVVLGTIKAGAWQDIRSVRLSSAPADDESSLIAAIDREKVLQGLDRDTKVYLNWKFVSTETALPTRGDLIHLEHKPLQRRNTKEMLEQVSE
jgi:hypothetical protein